MPIFNPTNYPLYVPSASDTALVRRASDGAIRSSLISDLARQASPLVPAATVADLVALDTDLLADGQQIILGGYYAEADGGGGLLYYSESSVATADDALIFAPSSGTGRFVRNLLNGSLSVLQAGAKGDGAANDTARIQAALDSGRVVAVPATSSYYKLTTHLDAPEGTTIEMDTGAVLYWTATTADGTNFLGSPSRPGIQVEGDNFTIRGAGILRGPTAAAYVANEGAIFMLGTSTSVRRSGLNVTDVVFENWGSYGVCTQFVNSINVLWTKMTAIGYAGHSYLSCNYGRIHRNSIVGVTPGSGGNAYGITITHDSTNYNLDPFAATNGRLTANPFCIDFDVAFNEVQNIPLWVGIDGHGGYECSFHHNRVYNCRHGLALASSSGDAANYAGENNDVSFNYATTKKIDGTAGTVSATDRLGLVLNGGSTVNHRQVTAIGNVLDGYGDTANTSYSIGLSYVKDCRVAENVFLNWKGDAIYAVQSNGLISGNIFRDVASATNSCCVRLDNAVIDFVVSHNSHVPGSGTAAAEGLRVATGNPRITAIGNNFDSATDPYPSTTIDLTRGNSDIPPNFVVTTAPTTVDITTAGQAPQVNITLNVSGICTITDFPGARIGQKIILFNLTTNNVTIDRTNSVLPGGANVVLGQYDTLVLEVVAATGTKKFYALSTEANS